MGEAEVRQELSRLKLLKREIKRYAPFILLADFAIGWLVMNLFPCTTLNIQ
jgi:hypothetical protein